MNNTAVITTLSNMREHPNADRLKLATVFGTQVIVGLESKEGDVVIYFDSNLQLSHDYLYHNNLYSNPELNKDHTIKGYFGRNGRVKAQKFRGEVSNGYIAELSSLDFTGSYSNLEVGDEFTSINGVEICSKYIVPGSVKFTPWKKKAVYTTFWKHWDTEQLMRNKDKIPPNQILYIEEKIHGTSARTARIPSSKKWWQFWKPDYIIVSGTRRVQHIGNHMPVERKEIEEKLAPHLRKGEQVYYEIFGNKKINCRPCQANNFQGGNNIQKGFSYGCKQGQYRVMLYRVTITTPDGICFDLSREQVYKRATELGMEAPTLLNKFPLFVSTDRYNEIIKLAEGKSTKDAGTLREGIVVWFVNDLGKWDCLKYKSEEFLIKESKNDDITDVEDSL